MDNFYYFITSYGYLAIFVLLMVGIFGIPLPDEILLCFIGYLVFHEEMRFWPATLVVIAGSSVGISVNYIIGRVSGDRLCKWLEYFFPNKLKKLKHVTEWVDRSGGIVLFFSYFVPGLRHWATVGAGVLKVSPTVGVLFIFPAAIIWSFAFICLGYHLAQEGAYFNQNLAPFLQVLSGVIILGVFLCYFLLRKKDRVKFGSPQRLSP
jgi:membrane protein DedA with SNARE-associated domain